MNASAETNPLRWKGHEKLADYIGTGLVAGQMTGGFVDAYKNHYIKCWALRNGIGLGVNELLKRTIHRTRPDGSDQKSFPSMHTNLGAINRTRGWTYSITATIGISRMGANKHFATDIAGGFILGELSRRVCSVD